LIAGIAILLTFVRPTTRAIDAADALRIATSQLLVDSAKDHAGSPRIHYVNVMAPGSGKYWEHWRSPKPPAADKRWCVEIGFAVGDKATGKGYYTIASDGTIIETAFYTDPSP
jgi:hypothetical protein